MRDVTMMATNAPGPPGLPEFAAPTDEVVRLGYSPGEPPTTDHRFEGRDGEVLHLRGRLLGYGTSHREEHSHPTRGCDADADAGADVGDVTYAAPGERCSACRWFEVRVLAADEELTESGGAEPARARYLVLTYGRSLVPGEVDKRRAEWTDSPYEVLELLTQRRGGASGRSTRPFLPQTSARVLAQAAAWDAGLRDAYRGRAG